MPKKEVILKEGEAVEALPNGFFKIRLDDGNEALAHLSGKMRIHYIKILPGDRVIVEFNDYNKEKGRIVRRL